MNRRHGIVRMDVVAGLVLAAGIAVAGEPEPVEPPPDNGNPFGVTGIKSPRPSEPVEKKAEPASKNPFGASRITATPDPFQTAPEPTGREKPQPLINSREIEAAARKLLNDPYLAYSQAVVSSNASIQSRAAELRSQCYIVSIDQNGSSSRKFDQGIYDSEYAKLVSDKRRELDTKYYAIARLKEQFLSPYRAAVLADSSSATKSNLEMALQAAAKWSAKKH